MDNEAKRIAEGLTEAQRRYMTTEAVWKSPDGYSQERWMHFPPSNTHNVLRRLGLSDIVGQISPLGLRVRTYLEQKQ